MQEIRGGCRHNQQMQLVARVLLALLLLDKYCLLAVCDPRIQSQTPQFCSLLRRPPGFLPGGARRLTCACSFNILLTWCVGNLSGGTMRYKRDDVFLRAANPMVLHRSGARGVIRLDSNVSEKNVSATNAWPGPVARVFPSIEALPFGRVPEPEMSCLMSRQPVSAGQMSRFARVFIN